MRAETVPGRLRRAACALAGAAVIAGAYRFGLRDPLASMSGYTAALMALNQLAPPLLLAALPPRGPPFRGSANLIATMLFDPATALAAFVALGVAVSLPSILDPTLADALFAAPLGLLELLTGLMLWGQMMPATRLLRRDWQVAALVWIASLPMGAVAVVWMLAPRVLYAPYLDVICRWDLPPLLDQKWAGLVMLAAGVPMQLAATWILLGLGDRNPVREERPLSNHSGAAEGGVKLGKTDQTSAASSTADCRDAAVPQPPAACLEQACGGGSIAIVS